MTPARPDFCGRFGNTRALVKVNKRLGSLNGTCVYHIFAGFSVLKQTGIVHRALSLKPKHLNISVISSNLLNVWQMQ